VEEGRDFLTVGHMRLEMLRVGLPRPREPVLVLLHEALGCVELWKDFPYRLHEATGLPVFAWSRQGHGRSDPLPGPRPLDYHRREAALVGRVLDAAGIGCCVLFGHSDGATIALLYAALSADARIAGLVLEAPHTFVEEITLAGIRAACARFESGGLRARLARHHADADALLAAWRGVWLDPRFARWDVRHLLVRLRMPVLVIQSDRDPYGSLAQVEAIREGCGGSVEDLVLAGCGHAPHLERPAEVLVAVTDFAGRLLRVSEAHPPLTAGRTREGRETRALHTAAPVRGHRAVSYLHPPPPFGEPVEVAEGLFWLRLPLPLRLDHVNVWLIAGDDGFLAIDTGFDTPETRAIWERVLERFPVRQLLATHHHPDHVGLAGWLCARTGAELWTSRTAWTMARMLALDTSEAFLDACERYDRMAGLPEELVRARRAAGNLWRSRAGPPPGFHHRLREGDLFRAGRFSFRVMLGEGHAPEMVTLVDEEARILIAADQILPRISPVVALPPSMPESDPLADFLESIRRYQALSEDVTVLPSHGRPFYGLHARIAELARHHDERLARTLAACRQPKTAFEIMPHLFDFEIDRSQLGFALGETLSHLQHLHRRGELEREPGPHGALLWRRAS